MGVSQTTFFRGSSSMAGWSILRRLRQLDEQNRRLAKLVADLSLDKLILQDVLSKKLAPAPRNEFETWRVDHNSSQPHSELQAMASFSGTPKRLRLASGLSMPGK
jgi:hypothetical protein